MAKRTRLLLLLGAVAALVVVAVVVVAAGGGGSHRPARSASTGEAGADIARFLKLPGDQVVTVPDGTYTAGAVSAPHKATGGRFKGWLVLVAQTRGGVVVDQSPPGTAIGSNLTAGGDLVLESDSSRVLLVGFRFVNGSVHVQGQHIGFWYTDHSFPAKVWAAEPGHPSGQYHRAPRPVYLDSGSADIRIYGSDLHDTGTALFIRDGVHDVTVSGVHIFDLTDGGRALDPNDVIHPDGIAMVAGAVDNVNITDSWIRPGEGAGANDGIVPEDPYGPIKDLKLANLWISDVVNGGGINMASSVSGHGIFGTMSNVRLWNNGWDRNEAVDGVNNTTTPNWKPNRIKFATSGFVTGAPPAGSIDPATAWRQTHPYTSWARIL